MAVYKVEICGVNTSKLPILKEEEKKHFSIKSNRGTPMPGTAISKGISALFCRSSNGSIITMKTWTICSRLAVLDL